MGNKVSPFDAIKLYYLSDEFERGNHLDKDNPMRWYIIILNLLGSKKYNQTHPRVMKLDLLNGRLARDCKTYLDDARFTGEDLEHAWTCARWMMIKSQYRGLQDAAQKRRLKNSPLEGCLFNTS